MAEKLKLEELTERMFSEMLDWAKTAETFVGSQAPLYVEELLTYAFWKHLAHTGFWFLLLALAISSILYGLHLKFSKAVKKAIEDLKKEYNSYDIRDTKDDLNSKSSCFTIVGSVAAVFAFFVFVIHATLLAKVVLAPRVYLIEYLRNMF